MVWKPCRIEFIVFLELHSLKKMGLLIILHKKLENKSNFCNNFIRNFTKLENWEKRKLNKKYNNIEENSIPTC